MENLVVYVSHEKRERIEPGWVNGGLLKAHLTPYRGDLGRLLIHLLTTSYPNQWPSVSMVTDVEPAAWEAAQGYADVTERAIETYVEFWDGGGALRDEDLIEYKKHVPRRRFTGL